MATPRARIPDAGWYVELPVPADEYLRATAEAGDDPEVLAGRAQAFVLVFREAELRELLPRLELAGGPFADLAAALSIEDLLRRGRSREARRSPPAPAPPCTSRAPASRV